MGNGDIELTSAKSNFIESRSELTAKEHSSTQPFEATEITYSKLSEITGKKYRLQKLFKGKDSLASFDTIRKIVNDEKFFTEIKNFPDQAALLSKYYTMQQKKYVKINARNLDIRNMGEKKINIIIKMAMLKKIITPKKLQKMEISYVVNKFEAINESFQTKKSQIAKEQKEVEASIQNKKELIHQGLLSEIARIHEKIAVSSSPPEIQALNDQLSILNKSLNDLDSIKIIPEENNEQQSKFLSTGVWNYDVIDFTKTEEVTPIDLEHTKNADPKEIA